MRNSTRVLAVMLSGSIAAVNIIPLNVRAESQYIDTQETVSYADKATTLTNFLGDNVSTTGSSVHMSNTGGDNFAMSEDVKEMADDFHYSADVIIKSEGEKSAALLVGVGDRNHPGSVWKGANVINDGGTNRMRFFKVPDGTDYQRKDLEGYDPTQTVHLDFDVKANGEYVYKVTSAGGNENVISGKMDDWAGGYIGILTYKTEAEYSNIQFTDRTERVDESLFHTTLTNLRGLSGTWKITAEGMHSIGDGDNFAISDTKIENFEYSANINNVNKKGAGSLMFRVQNPADPKSGCYVMNVDYTHNIFKLFEFPSGGSIAEVPLDAVEPNADGSYDLKVIVVGEDIYVYVNGKGIMREKDSRHGGESYLGLLTWDGNIEYQDLNHKEATVLPVVEKAELSDFKILTKGVTITPTFDPEVKYYGMDIPVGIDQVTVKPESTGDVYITLKDCDGHVTKAKELVTDTYTMSADDFQMNFLNMSVTVEKDGFSKTMNFAVNKWLSNEELAAQPNRAQFHVTPQINFMNDPNGMVYDSTDGYWHLFYQYSPNNNFYKQSQAHVRSKDLVNWEQMPLGIQIDDHGLIFSGSAVEDVNNTSGLFNDNKPGDSKLVSIYTYHNEKTGLQAQAIAYSKDHGVTWQKYAGNPVLPNEGNTLSGADFRDPKVFQIDGDESGRWYMVTAGGAAQIFTSTNLIHWTRSQNLTFKDGSQIHSECPGLIPVKVNGNGETKWIYNGSAGFYVVGRMEKGADGIYKWTAESDKMDIDSNANPWVGFGKYATMTFFKDGTGQNRQIGISWLQDFIDFEGKTYKGLQSLPQEYGLVQKADGSYIVTSNVVEEVNKLRDTDNILYQSGKQIVSSEDENILRGVSGIRYDLEGEFTLGSAKEFGFKLRQGSGKELIFKYNKETQKMVVDGRNAGYYMNSGNFSYTLKPLDGNKVKLRVIIDQGAVEAFGNDGEANISTALYQDNNNIGMEFFCVDGDVTIDSLHIYDMKSMYTGLSGSQAGQAQLYLSAKEQVQVGEEFRVDANIYPNVKNASDITWNYSGLTLVKQDKSGIVLKANKGGSYTVTATAGGLSEKVTINAFVTDFQTNVVTWDKETTQWMLIKEGMLGKNAGGDSFFTSNTKIYADQPFVYEADVNIRSGIAAGITFGVKDKNNVLASWFCANITPNAQGVAAKLFKNENGEIWNVTKDIPNVTRASSYHLKVEYDGAGKLTYYVNDTEVGSKTNSNLPSEGFIGIQTFNSEAVFNHVYVSYPSASAVKVEDAPDTIVVAYKEPDVASMLPKRVNVRYDNDMVLAQEVVWDLRSVDTSKPGSYQVSGKVEELDVNVTVKVMADKTELQKTIDRAMTYQKSNYTTDSWSALSKALKAAQDVLADPDADGKAVSDAVTMLNDAMGKMVRLNHIITDQNGNGDVRGDLRENATLIIKDIFKQTSVMIQASALKYYNVHGLYEAAMYVNGEVYEPNSTIELRLNLPKDSNQRNYILARVVNGQLLILADSHIEDDEIVADVDHLGTYAIVSIKENGGNSNNDVNDKDTAGVPTNGVNTGDTTQPIALMNWMIVSGFALYIAMKKRQTEK